MTETEMKGSEPSPGNHGVQLGIGTLIIIALIVTMCSGRGEVEKVQKDMAELKKQLLVIDQKLDVLASKGGATAPVSAEAHIAPANDKPHPDTSPERDGVGRHD